MRKLNCHLKMLFVTSGMISEESLKDSIKLHLQCLSIKINTYTAVNWQRPVVTF